MLRGSEKTLGPSGIVCPPFVPTSQRICFIRLRECESVRLTAAHFGVSLSLHFSCTNSPPIPPGPEFRYLYVHQTAKSTSQSCKDSGTLPTAWAKSHPQIHPCRWAVSPSVRILRERLIVPWPLLPWSQTSWETIVLYSTKGRQRGQWRSSSPPSR